MSSFGNEEIRLAYSPAYKAMAIIALIVLCFGGGWATVSMTGRPLSARGAEMEIESLRRRLDPATILSATTAEAASTAQKLVESSLRAGISPRESLSGAFPQARMLLGMLALDRDLVDFQDYGTRDDALGAYYRDELILAREMRPLRSRYEAAFAAAYAAMASPDGAVQGDAEAGGSGQAGGEALAAHKPGRLVLAGPGELWLPPLRQLADSHPFALDVFFQNIARDGEGQRGPVLGSLYPGIVVAAATDWSGGQGPSKWRNGGLSPAAGNGVVVYDPVSRVYCSYFHLNSVSVTVGELVMAGQALGRGGNSGMNARRKGHGGHVHIEIFDAGRDRSLTSYEIRDLLKK